MNIRCDSLLQRHQSAWYDAVHHPFLDGCKSGTITPDQFDVWLVQDFLFVGEFTRMVGRTLAAAPLKHFEVLLAGLGALRDELNWFRDKAEERGLSLDRPPLSICHDYIVFMRALSRESYAVQATTLWTIEFAYNQAWQLPGIAPLYQEYAERWGNPGFTEYVAQLQGQADEALGKAEEDEKREAEVMFLKVAELENGFWEMAFENPA